VLNSVFLLKSPDSRTMIATLESAEMELLGCDPKIVIASEESLAQQP
jgi:hypothetical protein